MSTATICMQLRGESGSLWQTLGTEEIAAAVQASAGILGAMRDYQLAALYRLAEQYDGGRILEIGTLQGRSARILAAAAPSAQIVTLTPDMYGAKIARKNVRDLNVEVVVTRSVDYLAQDCALWDMVFVDGDHYRVAEDVPWFNKLAVGGLIVFHDYTPPSAEHSRKGYPPVVAAVDGLAQRLGRRPDVLLVDSLEVGMAGFYRRKGEQA